MHNAPSIRVGIGGWTFPPWRGTFYPDKLVQKRELEYASRAVTAIEINATYHRLQKPESFANWAQVVPDDFVFAVKASRYVTNRRILAEAGESIEKFLDQGLVELGPKLGPILWQFIATKKFDPEDFGAFLNLLPAKLEGLPLRHAVQVRHDSFHHADFVALCRKAGVAIVYADSADYPAIADVSSDFTYARLENAQETEATGYSPDALDRWGQIAKAWTAGETPDGLPTFAEPADKRPRDTFVFMINGAKIRAPAAAQALLQRL
ncbi:DUF72 domain-containing protein [Stakelama sediminis]|uniref:Uncharacterized protein YecE (DUF72 family) n=1 Tax=Stakelama sediminis TaxID=463200 RepID=A0A840Z0B8_9SPHN|nr:DUF72 domain-containing protein [Stakelama sediminis]MBB5719229.1 uncharacterized protein YecE (DUF72 family) [Stakelama sediminis]